ncbi:MAG: SHOCT domain-containing protein [Actinomycetota bacterium]
MPLLDLFFTMLWFFLFFIWIWLLISVFSDLFRSAMSGWGKAGWAIFVIVLPFLGVFSYLVVHGGKMHERSMQRAATVEQAQQDYIRSVAGTPPTTADELAKLADLRNRGALTDSEYNAQKAALLGQPTTTMPEQRHPQAT